MRQFPLLMVAIIAWMADAVCQIFLYFAPTPFGSAYVLDPYTFYGLALFYSALGLGAMMVPFLALSHLCRLPSRLLYVLFATLSFFYVVLDHADHEVCRFMGVHYSTQMMGAYHLENTESVVSFVLKSLRTDLRGAYSALLIAIVPILAFVITLFLRRRFESIGTKLCDRMKQRWPRWGGALLAAVPWVVSLTLIGCGCAVLIKPDPQVDGYAFRPSRRQLKVAPVYLALMNEQRPRRDLILTQETAPAYLKKAHDEWRSEEPSDTHWVFVENGRPFAKRWEGECPKPDHLPKTILFLEVETLRATSLTLTNPQAKQCMPFLESLMSGDAAVLQKNNLHAAYWSHYITNGQPTIDAFMAFHTGIEPHSEQTVGSAFGHLNLKGFTDYLKPLGYKNEAYIVGDPFDSVGTWTQRWYDTYQVFLPWDDRIALTKIGDQIIAQQHDNDRHLISGILLTNHVPFDLPEDLPQDKSAPMTTKICETMQFDDQALKSFFERLDAAGALSDLLVIILGDHSYDLGEFPTTDTSISGHESCRHTVSWVPLVLLSSMDRMPTGRQTEPGSHADLLPTLLDLLGSCPDNQFSGHSLLNGVPHSVMNMKFGNYAFETKDYSALFLGGTSLLYDVNDPLQLKNLAPDHPDIIQQYKERATVRKAVLDYGYENGLF